MPRGAKPPGFGSRRPESAGNSVRGGGKPKPVVGLMPHEDIRQSVTGDLAGLPFRAQYAGNCASCGRRFKVGEFIRSNEGGEYLAVSCCGEEPDPELELDEEGNLMVDAKAVMPRIKHPPCPKCFQIPTSAGICGC